MICLRKRSRNDSDFKAPAFSDPFDLGTANRKLNAPNRQEKTHGQKLSSERTSSLDMLDPYKGAEATRTSCRLQVAWLQVSSSVHERSKGRALAPRIEDMGLLRLDLRLYSLFQRRCRTLNSSQALGTLRRRASWDPRAHPPPGKVPEQQNSCFQSL